MFTGVDILLLYLRLSLSVAVVVQPMYVLLVAISSALSVYNCNCFKASLISQEQVFSLNSFMGFCWPSGVLI